LRLSDRFFAMSKIGRAVNMRFATLCVSLFVFLWVPLRGNADVAVLLEEPYSYDGALAGVGHAAVYLDRICAASPVSLRRCGPSEHGVVISRYNRIGGHDWIAIPLIPYLYAVTKADDIPAYADDKVAAQLRDQYRRQHLRGLAPDDLSGQAPGGSWVQLVGSAYNRTSFAYQIETTVSQDDAFMAWINSRPNRPAYRALSRNCADFVRDIVNFYYPKALSRSIIADFGITTPKRVAKSIAKYSRRHSDLEFVSLVIPQVPGTIRRSRRIRGMVESVLKAKKYVVPLAFFQPYVAGGLVLAYLVDGRFNPAKNTVIFDLNAGVELPVISERSEPYGSEVDELPFTSDAPGTVNNSMETGFGDQDADGKLQVLR
jgi:hypothetical protein